MVENGKLRDLWYLYQLTDRDCCPNKSTELGEDLGWICRRTVLYLRECILEAAKKPKHLKAPDPFLQSLQPLLIATHTAF